MAETPPDLDFRWTAFFQRSTEPLFILNRRRQILFVNRAWESLTGLTGRDVAKQVCKRHRDPEPGSFEAVLSALSPPRDVLDGLQRRARRLIVLGDTPPRWWDVEFLPLLGPLGVLGILGKIHAVAAISIGPVQPLPEKLLALRQRLTGWWGLEHLPTVVPAMRRIAEQVRLASRTRMPVLLVGEAGAGKEWLARTIHQESASRESPFFALHCGKLPTAALVWTLFGPPSLAQRAGATLYLHEPSLLSRELQTRLCEHFAEGTERGQRPRLLAGSSTASAVDIEAGRLLEEFHCLLSPISIDVPPLRQRPGDLPFLVDRLLRRASRAQETPVTGLTEEAWDLLRSYSWPGNLRELYTVLASACRRAKGERLESTDLPWFLRSVAPLPDRMLPLDKILEQVERRLVQLALTMAKGNKSRAAELLDVLRPRLLRRMETLGVETKPPPS